MKNQKLFRFTVATAIALGATAIFWHAQPARADEYLCTDRSSGDWFTTDRDRSGDRNIVCRVRDVFSDRQNRDRDRSNGDSWDSSNRDDRSYSDRNYSDNNYPRDGYTRGYDDACAHSNPEDFTNNRGYAEGYRDGLQRCDRPQPWNRNASH
jgi:hypothetical protein